MSPSRPNGVVNFFVVNAYRLVSEFVVISGKLFREHWSTFSLTFTVGTLYHYYENKQQLYLSVLSESWAETFDKLNEISISDCTTDEKLHKLIFTLYYDIKERNGLGKVLLDNSVEELKANRCFSELKEKLFASVCEIISNLDMEIIESLPEDITMRLTESLLVSIVAMIEFHPDKDDDNISFLEYLLKIKTITKS